MSTTTTIETASPLPGAELPRGIGLTGRVAVSWAVAGGVLLGGFLVALLTLSERMTTSSLLMSSTLLFTIGGAAGFIHGAALGYLGRGPETTRGQALSALALAALYTIPFMAAGWVATGWIAMTVGALHGGAALVFGTVIGWVAGLAILSVAAALGVRALRAAYAGWADAPLATSMVAAAFAGLLVRTLASRPTVWGVGLRVTEAGAVILSLFLVLWVVGPVVTLALVLIRRVLAPRLTVGLPGRGGPVVSIALGRGAAPR